MAEFEGSKKNKTTEGENYIKHLEWTRLYEGSREIVWREENYK